MASRSKPHQGPGNQQRVFKDVEDAHKKKFILLAAELAKMAFGVSTNDQSRTITLAIVKLAKEMVDAFCKYHQTCSTFLPCA
jgi:hypothetical protein